MYDNYLFDLYGTLVDINTDEGKPELWDKLSIFYGYYNAHYTPVELRKAYGDIVFAKESDLKEKDAAAEPQYSHEAYPEIEIEYVFQELFRRKGVDADMSLSIYTGQFFRVLSTSYVKLYPYAKEILENLKAKGKKVYLLSNAQRIFTEYEMKMLEIYDSFDDVFISSTEAVKKPDVRFFNRLMDKYDMDRSRTIMIGNDARTDIGGAIAAGIDSFYIHSNISPQLTGDISEIKSTYTLPSMDLKKVMEMVG